jgi:CheY-like chemotaxis protein
MTNEAFSAILESLCNEARNSAHATFGIMQLLRDSDRDSDRQASVAIGGASADRLLRCLDDVRDLLSREVPGSPRLQEFDLVMCVGEIIEVLNLASGKRAKRILVDAPPESVVLTQDREALEQILMRVLGTAFELSQTSEIRILLIPSVGESCARLDISPREGGLATRLTGWLNANPDQAVLDGAGDVPFGVTVMVAGKHLRALGGSAALVRDAAGHALVSLRLPSQEGEIGSDDPLVDGTRVEMRETLNVLVAEDCDDSFFLTQLMLPQENVWRARDGREALQMIQKRRFDLVLMDVHMPGMDGYSAIRSIRDWETKTANARATVVVLSSDDLDTQRRLAAQSGCSGFLRKPVRRDELTDLLARLKAARIPAGVH